MRWMYGSTLWKNFKARHCDGFRKVPLLCLWDLKYSGDLVRITVTANDKHQLVNLNGNKAARRIAVYPWTWLLRDRKFHESEGTAQECFYRTLKCHQSCWWTIRHSPLYKREGNGAEMCPAIVSGIVTGDAPVSYWPIFSPILANSSRGLCEN